MPADILTTDTLFPELNGGESTDQKFEMVTDYLWLLREQLTYALTNLGIANFNQTQLGKLSGIIAEPLKVVLAEQETQFTEFGVELGKISGRITDVEEVVLDDKTGLVQKMAAFELQADGFTQSFTAIGKVLNGEDGKSGLVKDIADVAGNYISKSAVTQTAKGFALEVVGVNDSDETTATFLTLDGTGMTIKNASKTEVFKFDSATGDLYVSGLVAGSKVYGSEIASTDKRFLGIRDTWCEIKDGDITSFYCSSASYKDGVVSSYTSQKHGIQLKLIDANPSINFYRYDALVFQMLPYSVPSPGTTTFEDVFLINSTKPIWLCSDWNANDFFGRQPLTIRTSSLQIWAQDGLYVNGNLVAS